MGDAVCEAHLRTALIRSPRKDDHEVEMIPSAEEADLDGLLRHPCEYTDEPGEIDSLADLVKRKKLVLAVAEGVASPLFSTAARGHRCLNPYFARS